MTIILNAFSFLREHLREKGLSYFNAAVELPEDICIEAAIIHLGLEHAPIEAVFVNHKVVPKSTCLHEGDRVAFVPPGTPGSYRLMLGMKQKV